MAITKCALNRRSALAVVHSNRSPKLQECTARVVEAMNCCQMERRYSLCILGLDRSAAIKQLQTGGIDISAYAQTKEQQQVAYEFDCFKVCSLQCNVEWRIPILGGGIDLSTVLEHPLHPSTDSQRPCEYQRRCKAHDSCPTRTAIMSAALRSAARCIG